MMTGFVPDSVKADVKNFIQKTYLENHDKPYDPVLFKRASSVLGPLTLWLKSSVRYADICTKIEPLKAEVA